MIEIREEATGDQTAVRQINKSVWTTSRGGPEYYPRFGFEKASHYQLSSQWEGVPDEAFMVVVFDKGALPKTGSIARYCDEFDEAMQ